MSTIIGPHIEVLNSLVETTLDSAHGYNGRRIKRIAISSLFLLPLFLGIAGCISSSNPPPPRSSTTVVVPNGTTVICSDGTPPPCR